MLLPHTAFTVGFEPRGFSLMGAAPTSIKSLTALAALLLLAVLSIAALGGMPGTPKWSVPLEKIAQLQDFAAATTVVAMHAWNTTVAWLAEHYARVPTLMFGLAALVAFPVIAVMAAAFRRLAQESDATHRIKQSPHSLTTQDHQAGDAGGRTGTPAWPTKAAVVLKDPAGVGTIARRFELARPVVQIGRSTDTDIVIQDASVHRYHATIHCTEDAEYVVTDLSAGFGNGVVVNGQRVLQHQIFDGDEIRLGRAKMMFITSQT